jgi:hypothetical protein
MTALLVHWAPRKLNVFGKEIHAPVVSVVATIPTPTSAEAKNLLQKSMRLSLSLM